MPKDDWLHLAILYDKTALYSPSNDSAIDLFCESAVRNNIYPTIIGKDNIDMLPNFDGLFIRATTHPSNYTYEFATAAEIYGIKTIDSTLTIQQGCNKIWQAEMFAKHNIPHPKTLIVTHNNIFYPDLTFPGVLKIPDSCFSQGVYKINNKSEFNRMVTQLNVPKLIYQEFIESSFDWRITIFNHQFLFAIKYFMVKDDWKIIKYDRKGNYINGNHECVKLEDVPAHVIAAAAKCDQFLSNGLYGLDIKEVNNNAYVIEINDNANIDAGVEDEIEGKKVYDTIIKYFRNSRDT